MDLIAEHNKKYEFSHEIDLYDLIRFVRFLAKRLFI